MNWWLKLAKEDGHEKEIKDRLRSCPFFAALFEKHDLSLDVLDDLKIKVSPLEGVYCKANDEEIIIDEDLVESEEVFGPKFHYIAHEILHFIKRQVEKQHYFADPEEVESFTVGLAYQMYEWQDKNDLDELLEEEFLPLIKITLTDDSAAQTFFDDRVKEAKELLSELDLCNFS